MSFKATLRPSLIESTNIGLFDESLKFSKSKFIVLSAISF